MNRLFVVIARAGSKGVPGKNLKLLNGEPLLSYILKAAINASKVLKADIVLSTDSEEMQRIAISLGASAPFLRPKHLAMDNVPSWPVVQHAVKEMECQTNRKYTTISYLQPTSPFCSTKTIVDCNQKLEADPSLKSVVAVTESEIHPFRLKRLIGDKLVNYIDQGFEDMRPRQSLPKVYRRAGSVYVSRREVVMNKNSLVSEPCGAVVVDPIEAIDLNSPLDFLMAQAILKQ